MIQSNPLLRINKNKSKSLSILTRMSSAKIMVFSPLISKITQFLLVKMTMKISLTNKELKKHTNSNFQLPALHHPWQCQLNLSRRRLSSPKASLWCKTSLLLSSITRIRVDLHIRTLCSASQLMKILLSALNAWILLLKRKIRSWKMMNALI